MKRAVWIGGVTRRADEKCPKKTSRGVKAGKFSKNRLHAT